MCFSATASFLTAAAVGVAGIVGLIRSVELRDIPLATMPFVFALQQTIEGLLWLSLSSPASSIQSARLTLLYLLLAEVFWPIFAPIAALLVEPSAMRRRLMLVCLAIGVGVGAYSLWWILVQPHSAAVLEGHIVYIAMHGYSNMSAVAYFVAIIIPLLSSSRRAVIALGTIVFAGYAVSYLFFREAFVSVWCYFAAAASLVILGHFEWSRRQRLRISGA